MCEFNPLVKQEQDGGALQHGWIRMAFEYPYGKDCRLSCVRIQLASNDARNVQKIQSGPLSLGSDTSEEFSSVFRG